MRFRRFLSLLFLPPLLLALAVLGSAVWLAVGESGLWVTSRLLASASGGQIKFVNPQGRLLGPISIGELHWRSEDVAVTARGVELDWIPAALIRRRLEIGRLRIDTLQIASPPDEASDPSALPDDLGLPLAVSLRRVTIASLYWNGEPLATDFDARLTSDGRRHAVEEFSLRANGVSVTGDARLDGRAPFSLTARADARGALLGRPLAVSLDASGTLTRINLTAHAREGVDGEARATLTPFAAQTFSAAEVKVRAIDPATWRPGAPEAKLDVAAFLEAGPDGAPTGRLRFTNHTPGPLDRQRLPLASATVRVRPDGGATRLDEIELVFPDGGVLRGTGRWVDATLILALEARRLDAAHLVSHLVPTRFDGPLAVSLDAERQSARLAWRDERIRLTADAEHAGGTLTVKALELAAGDALLKASGRVETGGAQAMTVKGSVRRFDPSRFIDTFADAPATRIDADFEALGRLGPSPVFEGRFTLGQSRCAGMPLTGQGRLSLAWPRIHDVDVTLAAGPNRLRATGGFGHPGDRLNVHLDAPRLAPFGIDGALAGRFDLAGTLERPSLDFALTASRLGVPGFGTLTGLNLRGKTADEDDLPFDATLAVAHFFRPGGTESARAVKARLVGDKKAHRLEVDGEFVLSVSSGPWRRARLAATGGFRDGGRWLGQLRELRLADGDGSPRLTLSRPAALEIAASGGSVGPLALAGSLPDWTAELRADADAQRLRADAVIVGARFGRLEGRFEAGLRGPWKIDAAAPWQGRLNLEIADLAWLGALLGDGWQTGGKLAGALALGGTPAQPRPGGRLDGSGLSLRLADQGLRLTNGELAAEFDGVLLRVTRLGFASDLNELPRALRQVLGDNAGRFAAPGRIDVSGELRLGNDVQAENAFLDVRLERFGAWQLPDRWVAVSGDGRISWQAGHLSVSSDIGVDAGYWQLAPAGMPRLSDDVLRVDKAETPVGGGARPPLELDLRADLGRNFLFRGAGLQTRLAGDVRLRAHGRDLPRASGVIRLRDGRFDAYGRQLDIERGFLTFQGLLDDPALDVRAVRQGLAVEVGVQVGGTARRPVVRLVSDPELPDADKLAWLLLGHEPESMGASDAALLVSAAGELLGNDSGGVVQQLKQVFGIDEFDIRQGNIGSDSVRAPASRIAGGSGDVPVSPSDRILSVGKRLSSRATLAYEQSLNQAESVVKLTVNLTRRIAFVGRAGSDNALDVFYTLIFGQPPRRDPTPP
jgi:translocation and assembly module TamB